MKYLISFISFLLLPSLTYAFFSLAQTGTSNSDSSHNTTSINCVLTNNPANGDLVVVNVLWYDGAGGTPAAMSVSDSNGNSYTQSASSPNTANASGVGTDYIFYRLSAPGNASKTITATFSTVGASGIDSIICDDFSVSGGSAVFDSDNKSSGTGTAVNAPTVTVTNPNELVYSSGSVANTLNSVDAPWTTGGSGILATGQATGYQLSVSSNQTVAMTQSPSGQWNAMAISFSIGASSSNFNFWQFFGF